MWITQNHIQDRPILTTDNEQKITYEATGPVVEKAKTRQVNRNKDRDYINGPQLYQSIKDWYDTGEEEIPRIIVDAIIQICDRLGTSYRFKNYTYKDEMIGNALEKCIAALKGHKFDPNRTDNPFAYFTMIAWNEFIRVITEEHKQSYLKHKSLEQHITESNLVGQTVELPEDNMSGSIDNLIAKFEGKKNAKRK